MIITAMIVTFLVLGITYYILREALRGKTREYRSLPAIDAISDGVDRAVETGRPVLHSMGAYAYLSGLYAAMTLSAVNIMRYSMRQCMRKGAEIRFCLPINPETGPLIDGIYREVAIAEGHPERYRREDIYYFGNDEDTYRAGLMGLIATFRPATYLLAGAVTGTGDLITTTAAGAMGALVIGGQARNTHQGEIGPISFDYYLAVADVYAAGAITSGDQIMMSNLFAADVITYIALAMTIIGIVLGFAGLPIVKWLGM